MFQFPSLKLPFSLSSFRSSLNLPSVQIHDIEISSDRRARTLKHLIKANHANFSIIYNKLRFHNHTPHILGSAYLLGATTEQLNKIYDEETRGLEGWKDAPGEVTGGDWRDYLGQKEYQRAFIDFFEDELVQHNYDWKSLVEGYLFSGEEPLINNLITSGLAHPLIHLGYGYELSSQTVSIEALAMACCFHNDLARYLDDAKYTKPADPELSTASPLELLQSLSQDHRFDSLGFQHSGPDNTDKLLAEKEDLLLSYWNSWSISDAKSALQFCQEAAVALLIGTHDPSSSKQFDFFLVHLVTSSHALRILIPLIPSKHHVPLLRQWLLFTLITYITQLRPAIDPTRITKVELNGRSWKDINHMTLAGPHALDAHFVKVLRGLKEAAGTWGDEDEYYLKAALSFANGFGGWGGFGMDEETEGVENARHK